MISPVPVPDQPLRTPYVRLRRWLFFGLVAGTTMTGCVMMLDIVRDAGITALEIVILALFIPTFAWISVAFWNAVLGFALQLTERDPLSLERLRGRGGYGGPIVSRTALIMPAHNEDPERLMGGLAAMLRSLEETGQNDHFDVHLLSDTTDSDVAREEETAWTVLRAGAERPDRLHYRRRSANVGRKAGNIAEFCGRCGTEYDFMVVLDADSIMSGSTLVELVRAMQANPRAGLIQTVPIPARQETLFGRLVQFAAAVYSPILATGQSFWQTESANYWGHNAILRMRPFIDHCELPVLSGSPPLGGAILSHDFVEAGLLRRSGWFVYLFPMLGGSYEEVPGNVFDYAKRDRRWAQGSLQHLRLLHGRGFEPLSRLHFALGAMGYISSLLWLLILLASTAYVLIPALSAAPLSQAGAGWLTGSPLGSLASLLPLLAVTAVVLFLPKTLGVVLALVRRPKEFGGSVRLVASSMLEAMFAVVVAPVMMMYHARFVLSIVGGRDVDWGAQVREGREVPWGEAWKRTAGVTIVGVGWAGATLYWSPMFFLWLTPIFVGLLASGPLVRWTSSLGLGRWARRRGLLLVPSETRIPAELCGATGGITDDSVAGIDTSQGMEKRNRMRRHTFPWQTKGVGRKRVVEAWGSRAEFAGEGREAGRATAETTASRSMYEAERGLFDLRRGRPLYLTPSGGGSSGEAVLFAAVEGLDALALDQLRRLGAGALRLIVTPHRATTMGLHDAAIDESTLGLSLGLNGESAEQVFLMSSTTGPFDIARLGVRDATRPEMAGLALTRLGRLLPAAVAVPANPDLVPELREALATGAILEVNASQVEALAGANEPRVEVTYVSDAAVPLEEAENVRFMLFREANGLLEHVAILIGEQDEWPDPVPVRLHSACLTGDLFGSLRCDCGEQLRGSLRVFASNGGGVLLYLEQEGRGIGLGNKLRAYALQQQGLDTVDADCVLGFGPDERRYDSAVAMLRKLGIERVQVLTNNPEKVRALEEGGIRVIDRQPLHGTLNRHNLPYVRAKVHRAGHWLGDMLYGAFPSK